MSPKREPAIPVCRVCGAAVAATADECPRCGSRRPFLCAACGRPAAAPLNPTQWRDDGTVVCTHHAPWAACALCGVTGTYIEVSAGEWVYLGDREGRRSTTCPPAVAARLARIKETQRWLCPRCAAAHLGRPGEGHPGANPAPRAAPRGSRRRRTAFRAAVIGVLAWLGRHAGG